MLDHSYLMGAALEEARRAADRGEVPVGAVVVETTTGHILATAGNRTEELADPSAHAEILALRAAALARGRPRLPDCTLVVTLEPCAMCAAAISFARIEALVFGATDPKGGAVLHGPRFYEQPTCHHRPDIAHGIAADEAGEMLRAFFRTRRGPGRTRHRPLSRTAEETR